MNRQKKYPGIDDVILFKIAGSWKTKSGGDLYVLFSLSHAQVLQSFLSYDQVELKKLSVDIRGLRGYKVSNLKKGAVGGLEFHRLRKELLFAVQGSIRLKLTDVYLQTKTVVLSNNSIGVYIPPFVVHSYEVLEDNTSLMGIANTLYFPDDKDTYDTYSEKELCEIKDI